MVKYYKTDRQYIQVDEDNSSVVFIYSKDNNNFKSVFGDAKSYQNLLNEIAMDNSVWSETDENIFNEKLALFN
jgi:hypothetical protein